jgi:protein phosphatase PTC1
MARVCRVALTDEVEFLVMACDGVWDMVSDQMAVDSVAVCADPHLSATTLRDRAFLSGSTDNISVLVIYFSKEGKS